MRAVFDQSLPLERAAEGYAATDKRRATKVMLTVWFRRPTAASWLPAANADVTSEPVPSQAGQLR